jgi:hypothetical protein
MDRVERLIADLHDHLKCEEAAAALGKLRDVRAVDPLIKVIRTGLCKSVQQRHWETLVIQMRYRSWNG